MRNYKVVVKSINTCVSITCDVCKKEFDDQMEIQEFASFGDRAGYGNVVFGDGTDYDIDMCQYCFKEKLGEYVTLGYPMNMDPIESLLDGEE